MKFLSLLVPTQESMAIPEVEEGQYENGTFKL